jgi:hypothetical protein
MQVELRKQRLESLDGVGAERTSRTTDVGDLSRSLRLAENRRAQLPPDGVDVALPQPECIRN